MAKGKFYGIGVGPGDPELITVKARRVIGECDIIAVPVNSMGKTVALDIAKGAAEIDENKIIKLSFPMDKDISKRKENYRQAAEIIETKLDKGQNVALLTLGDVTVYSTAYYVYEIVKADGYICELIPGIPSFVSIAARLGVSLAEQEKPLHVFPGHSMDADEILAFEGTKVIMKSGGKLAEIQSALEKRGLVDRAYIASNCGMPDEYLSSDLNSVPEKLGYYTTLIVKD